MPDNSKLYDTNTLLQTHNADEEFAAFMISVFVKNIPETNAELQKASNASNWEKVYFFAHKMKASIDLFNLNKLKDLIRSIQQRARSETSTATIAADVKFVNRYINDCVEQMKKDFNLK